MSIPRTAWTLALIASVWGTAACGDDDGEVTGDCGNAVIEVGEECDRFEMGGATCQIVVPGTNGPLGCTLECAFDTTGCVDTDCGDGVAEGQEQCDGSDLKGQTCGNIIPGSFGDLVCGANCTLDTVDCDTCGDGIKTFDEECDCGRNSASLPPGCTAENGGPNANCSSQCAEQSYCGDGIEDSGEECDCGTDPASLPVGCGDVNGGTNGMCDVDCASLVPCSVDVWDPCTSGSQGMCCDDEYGVDAQCTDHPTNTTAFCLRECVDTTDCYWSNYCRTGLTPGSACWPQVCGPNWPDITINDYCTVQGGGGQGWCLPIYRRDDPTDGMYGICIEAGSVAHGQTCPAVSIDLSDRSENQCNMGLCSAAQGALTGTCLQFCDWQAAYSVAIYGTGSEILACPAGYNCFSESYLDPATGNRSGDLGYCRPTVATDAAGMTTCSLITNELLSNPAQTCVDAGFAGGRCAFVQFSGGQQTDGSLVGVCTTGTTPNRTTWEACSGADTCPPGTLCTEQDAFVTIPQLSDVCVPYCDTQFHSGVTADCSDLGAPPTGDGTPTCTSVSMGALPDGPTDIHPSRLGLCAIP